jgi:hypothetical protein
VKAYILVHATKDPVTSDMTLPGALEVYDSEAAALAGLSSITKRINITI